MESACKYLPAIRANIALKTPNPIRLEHSKLGRNARILGGAPPSCTMSCIIA